MGEREPHAALPAPEQPKLLPAPPPSSGGAWRKILLVLVLLAIVGGVVWKIRNNTKEQATTNNKMAAAADRPIPVQTAPVVQKTMPIYLTALGTVTAYNSVTIKTRVDGQLMTVNVREGQSVHKGQVLAQIDPRPYQAAVDQAVGQLVKDQANAKNADAEAARYTALYQAGVVSKESQQAQVSTSGQAAGSIAADQAAIQAAKVNLVYTTITSPIDGVVGLRQVDPGNIVHAADATGLILVTQLQPISVIFTLPEDQLPEVIALVRGGKKLSVEAYDRSESTHLADGSLLTLDNSIDPTTGTDKVKAVFANKDGALFVNQFVNVRLILQQRQNAIVVPASAIQNGTQGTFVYVVKPGNPPGGAPGASGRRRGGAAGGGATGTPAAGTATDASAGGPSGASGTTGASGASGASGGTGRGAPFYVQAVPVKIDLTEGTQVIIASGLKPGDNVVVDGQEKLVPNSRVRPAAQPATSGPAPSAGQTAGAFGPGAAGPSDAPDDPKKRGLETGHGVRSGGGHPPVDGAMPPSGQPHQHRGPGGAQTPTGQQP